MISTHPFTMTLLFVLIATTTMMHSASGFSPQVSSLSRTTTTAGTSTTTDTTSSTTALQVGVSFDNDIHHEASDYFYPQLLQRANDCAEDDECSLEEWESVMTEIEYISEMDSSDLALLMEGVHQLEERATISPWTATTSNLPLLVMMFLASTYSTVTAPYDEIVIRIGYFFQDWSQVAATTTTTAAQQHLPLFMCVAAAYVAVSEVASCFLPTSTAKDTE